MRDGTVNLATQLKDFATEIHRLTDLTNGVITLYTTTSSGVCL